MNRLVIIGNGFDLAHGLPSRYEDFVLYLINDAINELTDSDKSEKYAQLFMLIKNPFGQNAFTNYKSLDELKADYYLFKVPNFTYLGQPFNSEVRWTTSTKFTLKFNSKFFHDLFLALNWTDIEKAYFNQLSEIFNHHKNEIVNSDDLNQLNSDFELLKSLFVEYISKINCNSIQIQPNLKYHFDKCFDEDDLYLSTFNQSRKEKIKLRFNNEKLERIIFVNFNYTNLVNQYVGNQNIDKYVIPIHGTIQDKKSIVFGYGDEMTEYYKKLEDLDSENVLKHFKSHYYHYKDYYARLLYEVENFEFDVVIFGHSLGLSDRVLLNTIFENKNCKAIHLFHSGSENHFKKRIELSRHFDDKKAFRKKLIEETDYLKIERNN